MPFYQNVFDVEFKGTLILGENHALTFTALPTRNTSKLLQSTNYGPFNLSTNNILRLNYTQDNGKTWYHLDLNLGSSVKTTTVDIIETLNNNPIFNENFIAKANIDNKNGNVYLVIEAGKLAVLNRKGGFKMYVSNTGAEKHLKINKNAYVVELPSYFSRHTINAGALQSDGKPLFPDSLSTLILLDPNNSDDAEVITDAGLNPSTPKEDYELIRGRSRRLLFTKNTVDGSGRITETIQYNAGAQVGDFAKKTIYTFSGSNTLASNIFELPHVLTSGDLITPP